MHGYMSVLSNGSIRSIHTTPDTTIFPPYVEEAFIPSGSNVTACTW